MISAGQITEIRNVAMRHWSDLRSQVGLTKDELQTLLTQWADYQNGDRPLPPDTDGLTTEQVGHFEYLINAAANGQAISMGGAVAYAILDNGIVIQIITAGVDYTPEEGYQAIPITANQYCEVGAAYHLDSNSFTPPDSEAVRTERFYKANQMLLLGLLEQAANQVAATALMLEFKSNPVDWADLILYWNTAIAPIPPTSEQIATLATSAEINQLPVTLDSTGLMIAI